MTRWGLWLALPALLAVASAARAAESAPQERAELSQYGVTWRFAAPARTGQYVTGDWWVVGPVTVASVTPAPAPGRNGSVVNPKAGDTQGYDDRIPSYDAALAAAFPLALKPGQSLVSTASLEKVGDRTPDTVRGQYARGPLRTAVVLTCVGAPPPADAFRPPYVGDEKPLFRAGQLRRDLLPRLAPAGPVPDAAPYERNLQRIWLDHKREWTGRMMHPLENMPDYGREITNIVSQAGLLLCLDDPQKARETLLLRFVQLGIDLYGTTCSNNDLWTANGGHHSGRKLPILFAGVLLGHEGMCRVKAAFAEDEQTYYGEGYRGQKVLWTIDRSPNRRHEHLPPDKWTGPPFKGENNGVKSEGYRKLNGPTWVGEALVARLLGAKEFWGHDAFFDYVDRWVQEEGGGTGARRAGALGGPFVAAMWDAYRSKADAIGEAALAKARR